MHVAQWRTHFLAFVLFVPVKRFATELCGGGQEECASNIEITLYFMEGPEATKMENIHKKR